MIQRIRGVQRLLASSLHFSSFYFQSVAATNASSGKIPTKVFAMNQTTATCAARRRSRFQSVPVQQQKFRIHNL